MDNRLNGHNYQWSGGLQIALRDDDYEEPEVWGVLDDGGGRHALGFYYEDQHKPKPKQPKGVILNTRPSEAKGIPRQGPGTGTLRVQKSAPVNISYWPKKSNAGGQTSSSSSGKKKKGTRYDSEDDDEDGEKGESEEEEEGGWETRAPPHEIIARRMERSHISSFSVLEGVGRKLKGRDLAKVRRAVLTRTGFLESP